MKQFAFVDNSGQIAYIMSAGTSQDFSVNGTYGAYTALHVPADIDTHAFMATNYWDGNSWESREPKPSSYHEWVDFAWVFSEGLFMAELRAIRNDLLKSSDWTQMPDSPLNGEQKGAWATYRQELRDLPENCSGITSLDDVVWSTPPN